MKKYIFIFLTLFISTEAMAKYHSHSHRGYFHTTPRHHRPTTRPALNKYTPVPTRKAPKTVVVEYHKYHHTTTRRAPQSFSQRHPVVSGVVGGMAGSWLYNSLFGDEPAQQEEGE